VLVNKMILFTPNVDGDAQKQKKKLY